MEGLSWLRRHNLHILNLEFQTQAPFFTAFAEKLL